MWMYNFLTLESISQPKTQKAFIYTWNESEGYRGPIEICSAVYIEVVKLKPSDLHTHKHIPKTYMPHRS